LAGPSTVDLFARVKMYVSSSGVMHCGPAVGPAAPAHPGVQWPGEGGIQESSRVRVGQSPNGEIRQPFDVASGDTCGEDDNPTPGA
jgi:hypothetical protein